jgi:hypothetical protein
MKMVAQNLINLHGNASQFQGAGSDLKANLAMLLVENAALNANATSALMTDRIPDYQAASAALKDNTAALSSQFNTVYGDNAYNSVNTAWNNQSLRLAQYANALARQDVPTQQAARTNVRGFTDEFANGFVQANAQLPALTINGWGDTLSRFAINLIDAQDARNFAQEYQLRAQTNQQLLQLTNVLGQSIGQQFPDRYGIPSAPAVPANVGSATDDSNVASGVASGSTTDASATAGTGGATTDTGTADVTGATTAGSTTDTDTAGTATAGDASAASSTVLLPQTGAALSSSVYQVTGTTTTTSTDATGTDATGAGTSVTGTTTTTGTTQSGSVLLPQTGADLSSTVDQVTGTATTTGTDATGAGTTGAGTSVTGTTTTTGTTTGNDANTTGSGTVLLPQSGADLSSIAQQVTGTVTTTPTTGTAGAGTTTTDTVTGTVSGDDANTTGSDVLLPQAGADLSQQQQGGQPNTFVPIALVIAGIALIMAVVLMSFARRDYGQQKRDQ